jgi:hypothetical protein
MVATMFLAHLVGDYVLQWDGLAQWKSRPVGVPLGAVLSPLWCNVVLPNGCGLDVRGLDAGALRR